MLAAELYDHHSAEFGDDVSAKPPTTPLHTRSRGHHPDSPSLGLGARKGFAVVASLGSRHKRGRHIAPAQKVPCAVPNSPVSCLRSSELSPKNFCSPTVGAVLELDATEAVRTAWHGACRRVALRFSRVGWCRVWSLGGIACTVMLILCAGCGPSPALGRHSHAKKPFAKRS